MKKSIICLVAALGLLASCDPVQSEKDFDALNPSADALADAVTFSQYSKTDSVTPQENGNWIVYNTNPQQIVSIVSVDATGGERVLDYGKTHGAFMLSPSRGSDPNQQIIVRVVNSYGENVDAKKTLTVDVPTELAPELKMLCGENGQKAWKWNVNAPSGRYWGNCETGVALMVRTLPLTMLVGGAFLTKALLIHSLTMQVMMMLQQILAKMLQWCLVRMGLLLAMMQMVNSSVKENSV